MRLNLGAGERTLAGYTNLDRKGGEEAFPLTFADSSAEVIRASHILEHFSHRLIGDVLADWVRVLKPGGLLQIAVPDFERIARDYLQGKNIPVQGYVMGGQTDADDHHGAIFDVETLSEALAAAGLVGITRWVSDAEDCAALPVSLNLQGIKPPATWPKVSAVMSMPRLAFSDNYFAAFQALAPLGITLRKHTGAYWGQCLTRVIEEALDEDGPEYILTLDYDSVFTRRDVQALLSAAVRHPLADAIAPLQASRKRDLPMFTIRGENGKNLDKIPWEHLEAELVRVHTAHFGLTLIRVSALAHLVKPWFWDAPDTEGRWGDGRTDADISFWHGWEQAGLSLYLAPRVVVGHGEFMVRWPGRDLSAIYQHPSEFWKNGKPEDVWT